MTQSNAFAIQQIINKVAPDENMRAMLIRFFRGSSSQPAEFWELASKVAQEVRNAADAGELGTEAGADALRLVSTDGSGDICLVSRAVGLRAVLTGTHKIATPEDLENWRLIKAKRKLLAAGIAVAEGDAIR